MTTDAGSDEYSSLPKTIVVKFNENFDFPYVDNLQRRYKELRLDALDKFFQKFPNITLNRLFSSISSEEITKLTREASAKQDFKPAKLLRYYRIVVPPDLNPEEIVSELKGLPFFEEVYIEGGPTPPPVVNDADDLPWAPRQGYLGRAPDGIDARYAWTVDGGDGAGVNFVDLEQGWALNHEDLADKNITLISGVSRNITIPPITGTNVMVHGTNVMGEVVAVDNALGCIGIAPNVATARVVSQWRSFTNYNTADAILSAVDVLGFGDVLLLEAQTTVPGILQPGTGTGGIDPILAKLPVEVERAVFDAIALATARGITVVEAAGNGFFDLDTLTIGGNQILNRQGSSDFRDSGAIMVAAASSAVPHTRRDFSNFGSRIDCYAWGENVTTTNVVFFIGTRLNEYTTTFGGTSSASAMISGAALCVQGIARTKLRQVLSPLQMRHILSDPSVNTLSFLPWGERRARIGVMPNLRMISDRYGQLVTSEPVMFQNFDSKNFELVVREFDHLQHYYFTYGDGSNTWVADSSFGSNVTSAPAVFQNSENKNYELVVREFDHLHHYYFSNADGRYIWVAGVTFGSNVTSAPVMFQNSIKHIELVVREGDHLQHYTYAYYDGTWGWKTGSSFGSNVTSAPVMFQNADNDNYELVVREGDHLQYYYFTYADRTYQWKPGSSFGSNVTSAPVMFQNSDNENFELVVREGDHLQYYYFTYADRTYQWKPGSSFGSNVTSAPVMFQNADNENFELVVREGDHLQYYYFTYADRTYQWKPGSSFGSNVTFAPVMFQNSENKNFELVVRESHLQYYYHTYGDRTYQWKGGSSPPG